jgi:hypothetical protein
MRKMADKRHLIDSDDYLFQIDLIGGTASFDVITQYSQNTIDPRGTVNQGRANVDP